MQFTALHILIAFCGGFLFGAMFATGIHKMRQQAPQPKRKQTKPPPKEKTITHESVSTVETLDIPGIGKKNAPLDNDPPSLNAFSPAMIPSEKEHFSQGIEAEQNENDDATVLMHRPPPE